MARKNRNQQEVQEQAQEVITEQPQEESTMQIMIEAPASEPQVEEPTEVQEPDLESLSNKGLKPFGYQRCARHPL
jgi:hypothetical protein